MRFKKISCFLKNHWQIILILLLALFLRCFRIHELTTFGGDQGIDLLVVKRMIIDHQWTLLGPKTSVAPIFNGPIYYYMVLPFLAIFQLDPLGASYFMVLTYLGAIFLIYLFGKEFINKQVGILASLFFAIWPISVEYSRVSFNSFPTPFFAMLFIYSLAKSLKNFRWTILAGLSFGIMMQLHYFNFFLGFLVLIWLILKTKVKAKSFLLFLVFFLIGFSPMIMFELRHNFFNTRMLLNFLGQKGIPNFRWHLHYFISFFPVVFLILGLLLDWFLRKNKIIGILLILLLAFLNLSQINLFRENGYTMPGGWNMLGVQKVAKIVSNDVSENEKNSYEIAAILDGDTRAYPYRYFLEVMGKKPIGVEDYPEAEILYVVGKGDTNFILSYPVWEISSFLPAKVVRVWDIQGNVKLFKLVKKT